MKLNKKLIITGLLILIISIVGKLLFLGLKNIKIDDFKKAAVIFIVDSSASNQSKLQDEISYLKSITAVLDPEDAIKIIKVSQTSYIIFEGSPSDNQGMNKSLKEFTKLDSKEYGTAYGEALKKAFSNALIMKKEGYIPSIVVIGDLENEGDTTKQVDWNTLDKNVENIKTYIPEISMLFAYAHPSKLDKVKTILSPVLGEKKLITVNEKTAQSSQRKLLQAIGR